MALPWALLPAPTKSSAACLKFALFLVEAPKPSQVVVCSDASWLIPPMDDMCGLENIVLSC